MSKQSDQIFRFARLVCVFFLFWGCGKEEPPPKAKIVTKKIVREKDAASLPAQPAVSKDLPKTGSEKPPIVAQKPADTSKPSVSDQKKLPDAQKPAGKAGDKAKEHQKIPDIPIPSVDKTDKPSEKTEEISVPGASETSRKSSDKKGADLVFPDMPGLETEAKAVAAYDSKTRMDPFAPLFKEEPKKPKEAAASTRILTPLEKVDLSQLKLVGIVRGGSSTRALVEESSGKGYIIKKGTLIGIHSGKVSDILEDKVVIEEEHEDYVGNEIDGWTRNITVRKREMKLQKSPGDEL
jgi:type IV pilus assembly protein PilP